MLAIVAQGLADDDAAYVTSPTFVDHCCFVGLEVDAAIKIQVKYARRQIDTRKVKARIWPNG